MRVLVGTSGYSYKEWKGSFYPRDLKPAEMLRYYAARLKTVEINNTFYRMPSRKLLSGWAEQVPAGFSFAIKAPRRITHQKKLTDVGEETATLAEVASELGDKLGPTLFQLPPWLRKDASLLEGFLSELPPGLRAAVEFRSSTWYDETVYDLLRARDVALVLSDMDDKEEPELLTTASHGYLRLRRSTYDEAALMRWADRVTEQSWDSAHVFFKHEDEGAAPRMAAEFTATLRGGRGGISPDRTA